MKTVAHLNQWILSSSKELWEDRLCFKGKVNHAICKTQILKFI